jgi:hypothetical protein
LENAERDVPGGDDVVGEEERAIFEATMGDEPVSPLADPGGLLPSKLEGLPLSRDILMGTAGEEVG